jgi:arylsulfatase A-like enzyme
VLANPHVLQPEVPALAAILGGAGFATAAVVSNPILRRAAGFDQGFEHYDWLRQRGEPKARGDQVTDAALARVDALSLAPHGRLFLWVHYLDPHGPYLPPEATRQLFPTAAFEADRDVPLLPRGNHSGRGGVPAYQQKGRSPVSRDGRDYLARYAAEVRFMDGEVARLLEGLTERGILARAVVVLTADHGEALAGDHGFYFSHGNGQTQDQVHVPLVVRWPGCPAGETVGRPVSTLDVVPTVLARLGIPVPTGHTMDGSDLLGAGPQLVYGEGRRQVALRDGEWKAMWGPDGSSRLYRLTDDPRELRDLAAEHPDRLAALTARLREVRRREILAEPRSRRRGGQREEQELRALGYL